MSGVGGEPRLNTVQEAGLCLALPLALACWAPGAEQPQPRWFPTPRAAPEQSPMRQKAAFMARGSLLELNKHQTHPSRCSELSALYFSSPKITFLK